MKIKKKLFAVFVLIAMVFSCVQIPVVRASAESQTSDTVYLRFRYERADKDYEKTKLVFYDDDTDKSNTVLKEVELNHKDDDGVFAVVVKSKSDVLHYNFVKDGQKVLDDNAKLTVSEHPNEEILTSIASDNTKSCKYTAINQDNAIKQVNLHYYRYDENYTGWDDVWTWISNANGTKIESVKDQPFIGDKKGTLTTIPVASIPAKSDAYFIIRKNADAWAAKECNSDRTINKAYANKKGIVDAYVVTGDDNVYYNEEDVDISPKLYSARIDSLNEVTFTTNTLIDKANIDGKITLKCGDSKIDVSDLSVASDKFSASFKTATNLDLNKNYTVEVEGFGSKDVILGKILGSKEYADAYTYNGDLGAVYSKDKTSFTLWSPSAEKVKVAFYGKDGKVLDNDANSTEDMTKGENGSWTLSKDGDLSGEFYNYIVTIKGKDNVVVDPYAKATCAGGTRAMVVDLSKTNPEGWDKDKRPEVKDATDSVIYEMHIRDFTSAKNSGAKLEYRGKYKGVWQDKTTIPGTDVKTGIDHLKELGVNTVHLMPTFDYSSVDETKLDTPQFNWGYDPLNYNTPEGSYSTDPYTGTMRINEFKEMVKGLHDAGIRVVMDVVYNHTSHTADSNLNLAAPNYYYRQDDNFNFSNGSGCGNELASERSMVRRLITDSVNYWANEYHIDGFRFDLMGCHDIDTMKQIRSNLDKIDKNILMYGEGWTGGKSSLDSKEAATQANMPQFGEIQLAAFSDNIRDGIKGSVFDKKPGFVSGASNLEETIKFGVVASTKNDQIDYDKVNNKAKPWANEPYQTITYASAHDNNTLYDRLKVSCPNASEEDILKMNKMSAAIIYTSQGIPFMQAGEEIARTKVDEKGAYCDNSYNASDSVNQIDWERKIKYANLYNYYKGLIELRKEHKAFKMNTTKDIESSIKFLDPADKNVVAYTLNGEAAADSWNDMAVIFNANEKETKITLPSENWVLLVDGDKAGTSKIKDISGSTVTIPAKTSYVLVDRTSYYKTHPDEKVDAEDPGKIPGTSTDTPKDPTNNKQEIPNSDEVEKVPDEKPGTATKGTDTATNTKTDNSTDGNKGNSADNNSILILLLLGTVSTAFLIKNKFKKAN